MERTTWFQFRLIRNVVILWNWKWTRWSTLTRRSKSVDPIKKTSLFFVWKSLFCTMLRIGIVGNLDNVLWYTIKFWTLEPFMSNGFDTKGAIISRLYTSILHLCNICENLHVDLSLSRIYECDHFKNQDSRYENFRMSQNK